MDVVLDPHAWAQWEAFKALRLRPTLPTDADVLRRQILALAAILRADPRLN